MCVWGVNREGLRGVCVEGGVNREGSGRTKGGLCVWWWGRGVNREGSGRTKGCVCVCGGGIRKD